MEHDQECEMRMVAEFLQENMEISPGIYARILAQSVLESMSCWCRERYYHQVGELEDRDRDMLIEATKRKVEAWQEAGRVGFKDAVRAVMAKRGVEESDAELIEIDFRNREVVYRGSISGRILRDPGE